MLKVGLTGGIGSGKTYAANLFAALGIPIYSADDRAKYLMQNDDQLIAGIKEAFGEDIYTGNLLDRAKLASLVFNNKELLEKLNSLVHPAVWRDTLQWLETNKAAPYTIREAALVYETGMDKLLDKVIVVAAPLETRIERAMNRDNISRDAVLARINNQMDQEEKVKRADYVINNEEGSDLQEQVKRVDAELRGSNQIH